MGGTVAALHSATVPGIALQSPPGKIFFKFFSKTP
jgi:hypothetical protein